MSATKPATKDPVPAADVVDIPGLRGVETDTSNGMTTIRAEGFDDEAVREAWKIIRAGEPQTITGRRRIAIVGFTHHREEAPFESDEWEMWGMNNLHLYMPAGDTRPNRADKYRWDLWFQLHTASEIMGAGDDAHVQWLHEDHGDMPVMMFHEAVTAIAAASNVTPGEGEWWRTALPSVDLFPTDAVIERYPHKYFTNSVAWMTAFATLLLTNDHKAGLTGAEIGLWGVDMAVSCLAPETRILTDDLRWVPAGELRPGDGLIGFDRHSQGESRKWRKATVQRNDEVELPCYRLLLEDGTKIVAAANHKWLVNTAHTKKWVETRDLQPASIYPRRASRISKVLEPWETDRSWEAGYLAAAFDGEGHMSQRPRRHTGTHTMTLGFSQRPNAMSARVEAALAARGFDVAHTVDKNGSGTRKYSLRGGRPEIMRFLGQIRPERLLGAFDPSMLGEMQSMSRGRSPRVMEMEFIGDQIVMGLNTDTGTYIAEGFSSSNTEYASQRPSCEFYMGIALGAGITVTLPATSELLFTAQPYGVAEDRAYHMLTARLSQLRSRNTQIDQRATDLQRQITELQLAKSAHAGAIETLEHLVATQHMAPIDRHHADLMRSKLDAQYSELVPVSS